MSYCTVLFIYCSLLYQTFCFKEPLLSEALEIGWIYFKEICVLKDRYFGARFKCNVKVTLMHEISSYNNLALLNCFWKFAKASYLLVLVNSYIGIGICGSEGGHRPSFLTCLTQYGKLFVEVEYSSLLLAFIMLDGLAVSA